MEGLSSTESTKARLAWIFLDGAVKGKEDIAVLQRYRSPREAFEYLEKLYDPESEVAPNKLYDQFHAETLSPVV